MGPRAGLDTLEQRKISCLYGNSNPDLPAGGLVAILTTKIDYVP